MSPFKEVPILRGKVKSCGCVCALALGLGAACQDASPEQQDLDPVPAESLELASAILDYSANEVPNDSGELRPIEECDFAGPHQTVALLELLEKPAGTYWCDPTPPPPYRDSFRKYSARVVGVAFGPTVGPEIDVISLVRDLRDPMNDVVAGDTILVTLRKANGTWFALDWIHAELVDPNLVTSKNDLPESIALPTQWEDLQASSEHYAASYDLLCTSGVFDHFRLDEQAFEERQFGVPTYDCGPGTVDGDDLLFSGAETDEGL